MIFLTLGTQLPFDRLVEALDAWCAKTGRGAEVIAQVPDPGTGGGRGGYRPEHFTSIPHLAPAEHKARFAEADVVVSHAGMGTIITALSLAKPLIVMPRRADMGEHRNDHQLATARHFGTRPGVFVADTAVELARVLDRPAPLRSAGGLGDFADPALLEAVRAAILPKTG
ncbi:MAG: glycosyltransferase [Pseudomonadota bacterium]